MATTNLISKSLGNTLLQSGNGIPDHTAPDGSLYTDITNAELYVNVGGVEWEKLYKVSYGSGVLINNTTATTISAQNTWTLVTGLTLTGREQNGISVSGSTLTVDSNRGGVYKVTLTCTVGNVAGTNSFDVGISINGASPVVFNRVTTDTTITTSTVAVIDTLELSATDTINVIVRNISSTENVIFRNIQIQALKR